MELSRVVDDLSIPFWKPFLVRYFADACSGESDMLSRQRIREAASLVSFDEGEAEEVEQLRAYAAAHPALKAFIRTLKYALYESAEPVSFADFPQLELMGTEGYGYNLLLVLEAVGTTYERLIQRSVPEEIIRDTLQDIAVWSRFFKRSRSAFGFNRRILEWFQFHLSGRLFKLGRLQFIIYPFPNDIKVFRTDDDSLIAFCGPGQTFDAEGYSFLPGTRDTKAFESVYIEDADTITAHQILPEGRVLPDPVTVHKAGLVLELEKGTPMLDYHIQEGEPLDIEKCITSMLKALEFFPRFFPYERFKGFMGRSWLLDPRFKRILKPDSNIIKFMDLFFLYPFEGEIDECLWRVFGDAGLSRNPEVFPQNTGMQRAMVQFLKAGGVIGEGGAFLLVKDFLKNIAHREDHTPIESTR